ncbi:MAG TPA: hypothetical protein G4N98_06555 [Thermoflexia bacterium]|nr:hypothetical protein [Thermoflexia bacterium]
MVTLRGRYDATPEDYPLNQAARWALARVTSKPVKNALENYIQDATEDIEKSSTEGFEIVFILRHSLVMEKFSDGLRIIRDSFTDKSVDNPSGIDNVIWEGEGKLFRNAPDYMRFVDYRIYQKSIETMGREMLALYRKVYDISERQHQSDIGDVRPAWSWYNRNAAASYINAYTSNTTRKCRLLFHNGIMADQSKWNAAYTKHTCTDCTNYVSQGLLSGGMPTDGTWYPESLAWIRTSALKDWLLAKGYANHVCWYPDYLNLGDLGLTDDQEHVVMVGSKGPTRYSAHTNDRLLYPWDSAVLPSQLIIIY